MSGGIDPAAAFQKPGAFRHTHTYTLTAAKRQLGSSRLDGEPGCFVVSIIQLEVECVFSSIPFCELKRANLVGVDDYPSKK